MHIFIGERAEEGEISPPYFYSIGNFSELPTE